MLFSKRRTVPPGTPLPGRPVFIAGVAVDPDPGRTVAEAFPDALLEVYCERDPDWSFYRDLVR